MNPARFLPLAAALLLAGCSSQTGIWGQYYQMLQAGWRNSTGAGTVTLEEAAKIPYASLAYRVDGSNEAMLVLATDTNGDQLWTAASRVVLLTRNGRVLRSVGLTHDRGGMNAPSREVLPPPSQALHASYSSTRIMDFPDIGMHGVRLTCVATARGRQAVTVLGTALATTRVDEICESRSPRWSFTDSYWIDADGFAWQSVQHLHPSGTVLQIKVLRPPE